MENKKISVLMSVYKNDIAENIKTAVESIANQTVKPEQIVIVIDGEIPQESQSVLDELKVTYPSIELYPLAQNVGLGNALKEGMQYCRNEIVARMDSDDIAVGDRFEKQIKCFDEDEQLSIVGSNIAEFIGSKENVVSVRDVPTNHEAICDYLKQRCPFNHMTVMFKKSEVEKAGGYLHWFYNEDSYLWVRMYLAGCKFKNIPENLVLARINEATFQRRGGYKYYKSERDLFKFMYKNKVIGWFGYQKAKAIRFAVQVMMTNKVRQWFFKKFARS